MSSRSLVELLHGKGAHADPLACTEDLPVELASRHIEGFPHSVRELVVHMNYWMDYELRRIRGEKPAIPKHNSESFPPAGSRCDAKDWQHLTETFARLLADFTVLAKSSPAELQRQIESVDERDKRFESTLEASLWQVVAHNSYHIGQIAMIRRVLGAWPPRGGGDTW